MHLHIVQIDLSDPRISIYAVRAGGADPDGDGEWQTTLAPTSVAARREDFAVAINANYFGVKESHQILGQRIPYFNGNYAKINGWAVSNGEKVSLERGNVSLFVHQSGDITIEHYPLLPADVREAVSGAPMLVQAGKIGQDAANPKEAPAPHTGVGLDEARKTMTMMVVDGRRDGYSVGLSSRDFAMEFLKLGCHTALSLDGGGSSTLVMRDEGGRTWTVKNRPSDGHQMWGDPSIERCVAFVLGVKYDDSK